MSVLFFAASVEFVISHWGFGRKESGKWDNDLGTYRGSRTGCWEGVRGVTGSLRGLMRREELAYFIDKSNERMLWAEVGRMEKEGNGLSF